MAKQTPATRALDTAGVAYQIINYAYDPQASERGVQAAAALGVDPARVYKTLMTRVDNRVSCVAIPVAAQLSLKKLAQQLGAKSASLLPPAEAERISGYKVGGISPFGQRKPVPLLLDQSGQDLDWLLLNAGQRGVLLRLNPAAMMELMDGQWADLQA